MKITSIPAPGFESILRAEDSERQFLAFIAIHSTQLGPALGGVRFWNYATEEAALDDVKRLAESMTYKAAVANTETGGGKGVIIEPPGDYDRRAIYECFAAFINHFRGDYITAKDVGTGADDIAAMRTISQWVTGLPADQGGAGDPSPLTGLGVCEGIRVAAELALGKKDLQGLRVAIQGLGAVGADVAQRLMAEGCEVWGTDINAKHVMACSTNLKFHSLLPEQIMTHEADVLSPCALGQVLNQKTIPELQVKVVAGGANDQLNETEADADRLHGRNILYAPDFVINAGGLIHVAEEWRGYDEAKAIQKTKRIGAILREIFALASKEKRSPHYAAIELAKERLR